MARSWIMLIVAQVFLKFADGWRPIQGLKRTKHALSKRASEDQIDPRRRELSGTPCLQGVVVIALTSRFCCLTRNKVASLKSLRVATFLNGQADAKLLTRLLLGELARAATSMYPTAISRQHIYDSVQAAPSPHQRMRSIILSQGRSQDPTMHVVASRSQTPLA
jgi:hypothetical protein